MKLIFFLLFPFYLFSQSFNDVMNAYIEHSHELCYASTNHTEEHVYLLIFHPDSKLYQAFIVPKDFFFYDLKKVLAHSLPISCPIAQEAFGEYELTPDIYGIEKFFLCD